jgi:hypothetical protein
MTALEEFQKNSNQGMADVFLEQAALMCRDSMVLTPPIVKSGGQGLSKDAKKVGELAIMGDVHSVVVGERSGSTNGRRGRLFRKLGSASLQNNFSRFWKLAGDNPDLMAGNKLYTRMFTGPGFGTEKGFKKLKNYFDRIGSMEASNALNRPVIDSEAGVKEVHMKFRDKFGGRIKRNGGPGINFWERFEAKDGVLKAYIKRRQMAVGRIKSGWVDTLNKMEKPKIRGVDKNAGRSGINLWIKRHAQSTGYVQITRQNVEQFIFAMKFGNRNGDVDNIATDTDVKNLVYGNRVKQMPAQLQRILEAQIKKFNRK